VEGQIAAAGEKPSRLDVICGHAREVMRQSKAAIVTSGTATLETALIGTPHILVYKTSAFTYWFARTVVKIQHIGLVNIVAGKSVTPELIQQDATPETMAEKTANLIEETPERAGMLNGYAEVRNILGKEKASYTVAGIMNDS
jgi:lipid-A-disaccharide synthase